ncbi:MAG: TRAP transporter substrate-binding protein DctP [Gammaproteobacteria bacterium]|nr:TRAP transporter substrate-binding protein DctP [Gammaproteobacteria bacterium]MBU2286988.1 TRAP transporter substrate-binding protein DctP [Gammaproteobacteria bacterium]MBU2407609.1 TRAP transporter substrate-binding protein DctP [Gammaproteobacteria bacterium]
MTVLKPLLKGALIAACAFSMFGASAQQKPRKLTYATFYSATEFYEISAKYFMDEVTRRTNGAVTFETYYGGTLLKTAEIANGLSKGAADMASGVPAAFNPREFPLTGVIMPFISENPIAVTHAFRELVSTTPELQQEYQRNNQKLLWALASGENSLWTNKPINTAADLKGARIRAIIGVADGIKALGGTPISIPWVEALELVQRGGAEGVSGTPFNQAVATKVYDMAPYASNAGRMGVYTPVTWALNLDTWKSLDPATQRVFEEVAATVIDKYYDAYKLEMDKMVAQARSSKMKYVPMDDAEAKRWQSVAFPAIQAKWAETAAPRIKDPKQFTDRFTTLVRKYETQYPYTTGFDRVSQK